MAKNKNYPLYEVSPLVDFKDMLRQAVDEAGDKIAIRYFLDYSSKTIRDVTYREFKHETEMLGTGLASIGITDCHIAMVSENSYQWILTYLTVLNSSGVYVPIDKELPFHEIMNILSHSDSEVVFYSKAFEEKFRENADKLPFIKYFIGIDLSPEQADERFISMSALMTKGEELLNAGDTTYLDLETEDSALKMLVYTSGTTGTAKGVMLSLHNLVSSVYYGLQVSTVFNTCLSVLPYHHTYEAVCGLLVSLHHHSTICINDSLRHVAENLKIFKPDYIMLVPLFVENLYKKIRNNIEASGKAKAFEKLVNASNGMRKVGIDMRRTLFKQIHEVFGGNIIKLVCGGAPIRPEVASFFDSVGINLINGYGITECSPLVSVNRDYYSNYRSVGVKLPCLEIKIDEPNEDGEGEICVKGDVVMMGYYKKPEATADVLSDDGWFRTGDYGRFNSEGQLFITGRKKNLIVLKNGKNVYPEEIEEYLANIPFVKESVVYAVKNESGEETALCAEIFPDEEMFVGKTTEERHATIKGAIEELNKTLPSYKKILKIKLRSTEFDKTTSKKIRRVNLNND
jgi:long-chain acyl-CoA synthetase